MIIKRLKKLIKTVKNLEIEIDYIITIYFKYAI